jgi:dolichol-phosphate mannosyltransferase
MKWIGYIHPQQVTNVNLSGNGSLRVTVLGIRASTSERSISIPTKYHQLEAILRALEREREQRWKNRLQAVEMKLHWRALAIRHIFHVVPGQSILELGGGSGLLAQQLDHILRGENPISSLIFSPDLLEEARSRAIGGVRFVLGERLDRQFSPGQFDYVIGTGMLWHSQLAECLAWIHKLLKPGGQILFFEPNFRFPARLLNEMRSHRATRKVSRLRLDRVICALSQHEFTHIDIAPYDIVSCRLGPRLMRWLQAKAVLLEHMPGVRLACPSMYVTARKPGLRVRPTVNLAERSELLKAVSVVLPAHNEAANIRRLVEQLLYSYGGYIHEIVVVNDNSTDETAEIVQAIMQREPRVCLVNRAKPNGVGLALRDGYRRATGRYILSMDSDFIEILPELRGLFDAVASGRDGAIGSRFSHDSILANYPFTKLLCNRMCHVLIKLFLLRRVRDITNNLKLYRADILKNLDIQSTHFSANLETGLKPLLAGYDIVEVPISWINRTFEMGNSSFAVGKVGADYARALFRCWRQQGVQHEGVVQVALRRVLNRRSVPAANVSGVRR